MYGPPLSCKQKLEHGSHTEQWGSHVRLARLNCGRRRVRGGQYAALATIFSGTLSGLEYRLFRIQSSSNYERDLIIVRRHTRLNDVMVAPRRKMEEL